ncbi:hypothetical protein ACFQNJ_02640 [Hydrogenophaga bisanensis]|uniref:Transmembrane protein n=1 Tax=Hydrogenophaga bisanensis TaxID=439611 RepID=A0ABW2R4X7_9BURK
MESFMNRLTDMDWGWWPFVSLRPAKNEEMTSARVAKMAVFFGGFYGVLLYLALVFPRHGFSYFDAVACILFFVVFFFVFYKFSFANFWNRRAKRMQIDMSGTNDS